MPSTVTLPRIDCIWSSTARESAARSSVSVCAASSGLRTQTRLERLPGRGTWVKGPLSVWNSVEMFWCGSSCAKFKTTAVWG
ncbi:hypothetical protein D9M72_596420 [compost metagenome]